MNWVIVLWTVPACLLLCAGGLFAWWLRWKPVSLQQTNSPTPPSWPLLSVIIPACNEQDTLHDALTTLLAQDYPSIEFIVVNDRSTDNTRKVLDALASQDARITPVHIHKLPDNWLGKVHALEQGLQRARGTWILFTDADVHFAPSALRSAVAYSLEHNLDFLTIGPSVVTQSLLLESVVAAFGAQLAITTRLPLVGKAGSSAYVGIGAFNLVRRQKLEETPGLSWLRMEVADDVGLALMLHKAGARAQFLFGGEQVSIRWYPSVSAMIAGLEKNMVGVTSRYSIPFFLANMVVLLTLLLAPWVALIQSEPVVTILGGLAALAGFSMHVFAGRAFGFPWHTRLISMFANGIILYAVFRSAIACLIRGGIRWRGTFYSTKMLRKGQRVKL